MHKLQHPEHSRAFPNRMLRQGATQSAKQSAQAKSALSAKASIFVPASTIAAGAAGASSTPPRRQRPCRFGAGCTRPNCRFLHTIEPAASSHARMAQPTLGCSSGRRVDLLTTSFAQVQLSTQVATQKKKAAAFHWRTNAPPVADFATPYVETMLRPFESSYYKAAGILPLCWLPSAHEQSKGLRLHTLLGVEQRGKHGLMLNGMWLLFCC